MIFVTGGNGFIGRHLTFEHEKNTSDLVKYTPSLNGVDTILHLAQSRHYKSGFHEDIWKVNADATFRLLNAARNHGVRRFVLASSGTTAGIYGASKASAALIARAYSDYMEILILNLYCVYGEGMREDCLASSLTQKVREQKPIWNGLLTRPTFVGDVASAMEWACVGSMTGQLAISGPEALSVHQMAEIIGKRLGIDPILEQSAPDHLYQFSSYPCSTRFEDSPYVLSLKSV